MLGYDFNVGNSVFSLNITILPGFLFLFYLFIYLFFTYNGPNKLL